VTNSAPVLLIGFNRPEHLARTIRGLASSEPRTVLLAIDGPRPGNSIDSVMCKASQRCIDEISWKCDVKTRFREQNLGIRYAVVDAVNWAIDLYGRVVVLEDDAEPGLEAVSFADMMLTRHQSDNHIGHISLYNVVPESHLARRENPTRLSLYPESYAWATWHRAWRMYQDDLSWIVDRSNLAEVLDHSNIWRPRKWSNNFRDAQALRIDTWAYRWIASLWRHQLLCLSPNRNLVRYTGQSEGTHTRRKQRWREQDVSTLPSLTTRPPTLDTKADSWLSKHVFRETSFGYVEGLATSLALKILQRS
jgi:hypothetical protein